MPKIIENLRERILGLARELLLKNGYGALTIRGVARSCGIAVGTVYNYFPSKEMLAASVMSEDWHAMLERVSGECAGLSSVGDALRAVYGGVGEFSATYRGVWDSYTFSPSGKLEYVNRRGMLVGQLADILVPVLERRSSADAKETSVFLAENVLICTKNSELSFDALLRIIGRIL